MNDEDVTRGGPKGVRKVSQGTNGRPLTDVQAARIRGRILEIIAELGTEAAAAKAIGISQQMCNFIARGVKPAGLRVADLLAAYDGVPIEHYTLPGTPTFQRVVRAHPGRWSPWTVTAGSSLATARGDEDRDAAKWVAKLDQIEALLERAIPRRT